MDAYCGGAAGCSGREPIDYDTISMLWPVGLVADPHTPGRYWIADEHFVRVMTTTGSGAFRGTVSWLCGRPEGGVLTEGDPERVSFGSLHGMVYDEFEVTAEEKARGIVSPRLIVVDRINNRLLQICTKSGVVKKLVDGWATWDERPKSQNDKRKIPPLPDPLHLCWDRSANLPNTGVDRKQSETAVGRPKRILFIGTSDGIRRLDLGIDFHTNPADALSRFKFAGEPLSYSVLALDSIPGSGMLLVAVSATVSRRAVTQLLAIWPQTGESEILTHGPTLGTRPSGMCHVPNASGGTGGSEYDGGGMMYLTDYDDHCIRSFPLSPHLFVSDLSFVQSGDTTTTNK